MDQVNAVVVGYGYAGRCFHSYLIGLEPALNLYGVVSSRPEARRQIGRELGVRTFETFGEALVDDDVDLVVLATPNDLHAAQAITALEAGKHVVTDKPMCFDAKEADSMMAAASKADRLLSVFQNRRWDGDFLTVAKVVKDEGLIGDVFCIEMAWQQYGQPRSWRAQRSHGGGKLFDLGAHMIDQALQLVSADVQRVYARYFSDGWQTDVEDHAHCILTFANGVDVHVATSSLARIAKPRWRVLGTKGTLVKEGLDPQESAMVAGQIDAAREEPANYARVLTEIAGQPAETTIQTISGRWRGYYENVAAAVQGRDELAVTARSVRRVMAVLDAVRLSAESGEAIEVESGNSR